MKIRGANQDKGRIPIQENKTSPHAWNLVNDKLKISWHHNDANDGVYE